MKVKHIVLTVGLAIIISIYLVIQPFLLCFLEIRDEIKNGKINFTYNEYAIKTSIFKFQKEYTLDTIIFNYERINDYKSALKYIKQERKLFPDNKIFMYREYDTYMKLKDYDNALKIAKEDLKIKSSELKVYLEIQDIKNARKLLPEYEKEAPQSRLNLYYKAQIEYIDKNYLLAQKYIDEYLSKDSTYIKGWELKADIAAKLNDKETYNKTSNKIKELKKQSDEYIKKSMDEIFKFK